MFYWYSLRYLDDGREYDRNMLEINNVKKNTFQLLHYVLENFAYTALNLYLRNTVLATFFSKYVCPRRD